MKLIVLGSGTSVPHPQRAESALWLDTGAGTLLLDAGAATAHRLAREGVDWVGLDAIWVSHFHLDHVGGLAPFLFGTKYAPQTQTRRKPLVIYGPRGTQELLHTFDRAGHYELMQQPFPLEIREVAPRTRFDIFGGLHAETFSTPHTRESLAIRLTDDTGASFVYTSDTGYVESLSDFARDVDLLIIECSFPYTSPVKTHLVLEEALKIVGRSGTRRALLTHLYPEWDGVDMVAEGKKLWDGEIIEARDGMKISF